MFGWSCSCLIQMDFPIKKLGILKWPEKNNFVIYEEVYRFMITFLIYKDNVFWVSQIL